MNSIKTLKKKGVEIFNPFHYFSPLCYLYTTPPKASAISVEVKGIEPSHKDYLKITLYYKATTSMPLAKIGNYGSKFKVGKVKIMLVTDIIARYEIKGIPAVNREKTLYEMAAVRWLKS